MARIPPLERDEATTEIRERYDDQIRQHGRVTNMKRTLGHDPLAFDTLMMWYPLRERVAGFLGDRDAYIFAHAISDENDCLICSTFFRRIFIDAGENPETFEPNPRQQLLIDYGRRLARDPHNVDDELYAKLERDFTQEQIVVLTTFGAMMIATNVFNDALRVDLDDVLYPYRAPSAATARSEQA
jgi:alkylhydroperoxidase family enzyme